MDRSHLMLANHVILSARLAQQRVQNALPALVHNIYLIIHV